MPLSKVPVLVIFFGLVWGSIPCYGSELHGDQSKVDYHRQVNGHAKKDEKKALRVGIVSMQTGAILRAGYELGYFHNAGKIEFIIFTSAQQVAIAVASGQVDIGQTGLTAAVYNLAEQKKLQVIAGSFREQVGWAGMAYVVSDKAWKKGIRRPKDLKNAKFGITEAGSTMDYTIGLLAEKYGFKLNRGHLITLQVESNLTLAVQSGLVDGIVINAATADHLSKKSNTHTIGYVRDETPWQVVAFFSNNQAIRAGGQSRLVIASFIEDYKKMAIIHNRLFLPDNDNRLTIKEKKEKDTLAKSIANFVKSSMTLEQVINYPPFMDPECYVDLNSIKHQIGWYQKYKMVDKNLRVEQVVDSSFMLKHAQK